MRDGYLIRVNLHQQLWDGTVCRTPLQHRDCYQKDQFKSLYCEQGDSRCYFVNLFHPLIPSLRLAQQLEGNREVFEAQRPEPGDLCFFWGTDAEASEWAVGLWQLDSYDHVPGRDAVLRARSGTEVRFPLRSIRARQLRQRIRHRAGGDAARLLPAENLPVIVDQLLIAAEEDFRRRFDAGRDADEIRGVLATLKKLRAGLPEPVFSTESSGRLTQRIVVPPLVIAPAGPDASAVAVPAGPTALPAFTDPAADGPASASADPVSAGPGPACGPLTLVSARPEEEPARAAPSPPRRVIDGFPAELVADYGVALSVSPLVLLAGPSGSGKTYLTRAYAEAIGAEYHLVAVRPDWRANEDLLGYLPAFGGEFVASAFTQFVRLAAEECDGAAVAGRPPRPFHVCLDEMNLARPEYYMAEVLSRMELSGADRRLHLYDARADQGFPRDIPLPPNLSIVGTVNNDDTTHPFSAKVLDRAVYLVCDNIDLRGWFDSRPPTVDGLDGVLIELDGILRPTGARVGYRVAAKVVGWVSAACGQGRSELAALDAAISTLVLAKVRLFRSDPRHLAALEELRTYLQGLGDPADEAMTRSLREVDRLEETLRRREVAFGQLET